MQLNPLFDPFVETGYLGYSLRGVAHRHKDGTFRASLEIRDYRYASGELLYESMFSETFTVADAAIERAIGRGHQVVDDLLQLMNIDEAVES
jgi:hypothetical protein